VVGYSYQDTHLAVPSSPGWGFSVFWVRNIFKNQDVSRFTCNPGAHSATIRPRGYRRVWSIVRFYAIPCGVKIYLGISVFSFFPPSTTIRLYQRASLATSSTELGAVYCSIISFANNPHRKDDDTQRIMQSLVAIRSKLKRSLVLRTNVIYEVSVDL